MSKAYWDFWSVSTCHKQDSVMAQQEQLVACCCHHYRACPVGAPSSTACMYCPVRMCTPVRPAESGAMTRQSGVHHIEIEFSWQPAGWHVYRIIIAYARDRLKWWYSAIGKLHGIGT
jgi:hypothetical protein